MDSQPNPFADEPLPTKGPRLQSTDPLNPYAAPATSEEYNPAPAPGIGMWRDGALLVMHIQAVFPNRCLITGEETTLHRWQGVRWYYPIDWSTRTLHVEYATSPAARRKIARGRIVSFLIAAAGALVLFTSVLGYETLLPLLGGWGIFICIVTIVAGLHYGLDAGRVLRFQRVRYPYLWLTGVQQPFLSTLPEWPGWGQK
jgi:hypothetical protein